MRRAGHFGSWRALSTIPAMVGSLLLLFVLFGRRGEWEGAVLLGWIASGAAVSSRVGEHAAVRVGAGFVGRRLLRLRCLPRHGQRRWPDVGLSATDVDLRRDSAWRSKRLHSTHRPQPRLDASVIGFYAVVRVLVENMPRRRGELVDQSR